VDRRLLKSAGHHSLVVPLDVNLLVPFALSLRIATGDKCRAGDQLGRFLITVSQQIARE
jgi:hypothetical protein